MIKANELLNYVAFNRNDRISLAFNPHVKFSQLMGSISSLQQRMEEKLAQFQKEVRLGQEETAAKTLKKPRYDNSCMSYSIPLMSFLGHLLPALTW